MEYFFLLMFMGTATYLGVLSVGCFRTYLEFKQLMKEQESCDHKYVLEQCSLLTWNKDFTEKETSTKAKCFMCGHETVRRYVEPNKD